MNKFLLLILLIFVQSKKLNTFQEFDARDLSLISKDSEERLRNNKELKTVAYEFYDLLEKSTDDQEIADFLCAHLDQVKPILTKEIKLLKYIYPNPESINKERISCILNDPEKNLRERIKKAIKTFFENEEEEDNKGEDLAADIFLKLGECPA